MEISGGLAQQVIDPDAVSETDGDVYRGLSADAAAGVAIVSTRLRRHDYAATVTGYLSVSYDPPTMLVSLYGQSRIADAVADTGRWTLSLLGTGHRGIANWLASPGTPLHGLLAQVPFRRSPASGAVVIDGALAHFDLETTAVHEAATHLLFVGRVTAMGRGANGDAAADPLLHFASDYHRLGARV